MNESGVHNPVTTRRRGRRSECADAVRHAEDFLVFGRQKFLLSCSKPLIARVALALGAMAVATGIIRDGLMTAAVTLIAMSTQRGCTAARNGVEDLDLRPGQGLSIAI